MPPADRDSTAPDLDSTAALRRLEQRLQSASGAAQQLLDQALSEAASGARKPPPAGFQRPADDESADHRGPGGDGGGDLERLLQIARELRELIPPELHLRLIEAFNELLLALRALIDWVLERQQRGRGTGAEVQDIPIL